VPPGEWTTIANHLAKKTNNTMNSTNNKGISRLDFLKSSGFMAAGMAFLPGFISCGAGGDFKGYQLVIPAAADATEKEAADRLQQYLSQLAGSSISIVNENEFQGTKGIYIGQTDYAKAQDVDGRQLADGGYLYKPVHDNIILVGGAKKGLVYGVYDLLEGLGFRRYSPEYTYVPKNNAGAFP